MTVITIENALSAHRERRKPLTAQPPAEPAGV